MHAGEDRSENAEVTEKIEKHRENKKKGGFLKQHTFKREKCVDAEILWTLKPSKIAIIKVI